MTCTGKPYPLRVVLFSGDFPMSDEPRKNACYYAVTPAEVANIVARHCDSADKILGECHRFYNDDAMQRAFTRIVLSRLATVVEDAFERIAELSPIGETTDNGKAGDQ
jgi:hypothetical protein